MIENPKTPVPSNATSSPIHTPTSPQFEEAAQTRSAVRGAAIGFYVDMFDVYLPVIALAPAMMFFVSPDLDAGTKSVIGGLIFASTLVARPIGSIMFGRLADRIGRRRSTIVAVLGCSIATGVAAILPGFQHIGIWSVVLIIAVRFVGGIFMGGEYTGAVPLAMEASPRAKRGLYGGIIASTFPLAYCTISAISLVLLTTMPSDAIDSAYVQWGWRIPFAVGAIITLWFAWYYARTVNESESWKKAQREEDAGTARPATPGNRPLLHPQNRRTLIRVFLMMTGVWFGSNVVSVILPAMIGEIEGFSSSASTGAWLICQLLLVGGYLLAGLLAQRIGRKLFFILCGVTMAIVSSAAIALLASGNVTGFIAVTVVALIALLGGTTTFGAVATFVCESFPLDVRGTGYGIGYSLAIVIPSFYAFYQEMLTHLMPREYTSIVLLVVGGALVIIGALMGPETKNRDLQLTTAQLYAPAR